MSESEYALGQLRVAAHRLQQAAQPVHDATPGMEAFWRVLERCLRDDARSFKVNSAGYVDTSDAADYYTFFSEALSNSTVAPLINQVAGLGHNATATGRGRALLRELLVQQRLAETIQMACESGSVLKRHYHHGAVLRDERLRSQFVDILYDLNDVAFVLENKTRLDVQWPALAAKSFDDAGDGSRKRISKSTCGDDGVGDGLFATSRGTAPNLVASGVAARLNRSPAQSELSAGSLQSSGVVASTSLTDLQRDYQRLQAENQRLVQAMNDLTESKNASDEMITVLKDRNFALKTRITELEASDHGNGPVETAETHRAQTPPEQPAKGTASLEDQNQQLNRLRSEVMLELNTAHEQEIGRLNSIAAEHQTARAELQTQFDQLRVSTAAEIAELQEKLRETTHLLEAERKTIFTLQANLSAETKKAANHAAEVARLNEQLSAQNQSIEEHVASVQQAELARSVAMGQMATLRTKLQEESQRADELERHLAVKEKLLERTTHVKIRLGERCAFLMDAVEQFLSTWQPDSASQNCRVCGRQFGIALRRHHCRMCGNLFCNDCSSHYYQLANHKAPVRTCQSCASVLERLKQLRQEDIDAPPEADDVSIRGRLNSHALRAPPQQQQPHGNEPITPPPSRGRNTSGPPSEPSTPGGLAIPRGRPGLNYSGAGGGAGAGGGGAGVLLTPPARISSSHNFGQHLTPTEGSPS